MPACGGAKIAGVADALICWLQKKGEFFRMSSKGYGKK